MLFIDVLSLVTSISLCACIVYVRPLLEHNAVSQLVNLKCDIEAIERVQRRFTKRIPRFDNYTYLLLLLF